MIGKPILELGNSARWNLLWSETITATPSSTSNSWVPIPPSTIPIQFSSHIIVIQNIVRNPNHYKRLGYLIKRIQLGISPTTESNSRYRLYQNQTQLFSFSPITTTYSINIMFDWWVQNVELKLYEYVGLVSDTITEKLDDVGDSIEHLSEVIEQQWPPI